MNSLVVVGIGNPYRRDDGVGPAVLHRLTGRVPVGTFLAESDGEPAALIELWDGARLTVVIDAVHTPAGPRHAPLPGRVYRLGVHHPGYRAGAASSHAVDLGEAVGLARVLGRLPQRMLLYGIEAGAVGFGVGLTPAVARAADRVAAEVSELLAAEAARIRDGVA
ncbi:MAG TPA: hydrogenase maturation protease [Micromonosporaceae bacterium]|nr:hydrogenase maturation protease [Micromonosporaceae bacterium]